MIEAAVSDVAGQASFVHYRDRPAWSGFVTRPDDVNSRADEIVVDVVRLDDALPGDFRPALIKIDVEGAELLVLRGGIETLRRHRPIVVFEHARAAALTLDPALGVASDVTGFVHRDSRDLTGFIDGTANPQLCYHA